MKRALIVLSCACVLSAFAPTVPHVVQGTPWASTPGPVPEPASLPLLGTGLATVGLLTLRWVSLADRHTRSVAMKLTAHKTE